jgi:predicted Zn-dependent protease
MQLARACQQLGLTDKALKTLGTFSFEYATHEPLWLLYAELLGHTGNWPEMRDVATRLRLENRLAGRLDGFAYLLEGWVEARQSRPQAAAASFAKVPSAPPLNAELLVFVARKLVDLGVPQMARQLVESNPRLEEKNPDRLDILASVAFATKDEAMLLQTTERAYTLNPRHWPSVHNYAAALLITRQQPAKAVTLTVDLQRALPRLAAVRVNHALALIQNHRVPEAMEALKSLNPATMNESERTAYHFAQLEVAMEQGNQEQARGAAGKLQEAHLFPSQLERVRELQARFAK